MKDYKTIFAKFGISITFMILIVFFALGGWILKDQDNSSTENRPLQQFPKFSSQALMNQDWQAQMENYLSDQFPMRSTWIKIHTNLEHELGINKFKDVFIGKEDTLFQESVVPSKKMMKEKIQALNTFADAHGDQHISMLLVPNKATIWEDRLPKNIESQNQESTLKTFAKGLNEKIHFVDTVPILQKNKKEELYYKSDHHWTGKGAYYAFSAWKESILPSDPLLKYESHTINDSFYGTLANTSGYYKGKSDHVDIYTSQQDPKYTVKYSDSKEASTSLFAIKKSTTNNPYEVFLNGNQPLIEVSTTVENTKHLLLLKDSYANCFVSYLLPYYSHITIVDPRYYYEDLNQLILDQNISDVLLLYNANTFFSDNALQSILSPTK